MTDSEVTASGGAGERGGEPRWIGSYRVLSQIGEGGFGVVYEAEQTEPVRRRVALKVVKAGMDSAAVVARFEAERQALAVMDHPCIAKVFDGGVTPPEMGSRPYFVMELVRGEEITGFCDRQRLSIDDRVGLFARVCEAVQHAHNKGVIHRDLKPSNILVAYDAEGRATPKVIDFGVAKALNQRLTEKTIFTERGQLIGTPEYMSPEQAEMSGVDIDTRTDVYSLGAVLYELLTGVLPFEPATLRRAAYVEIHRIIREVEPPRPSTRLGTVLSGDGDRERALRIVGARHTDARSLTSVLRRDLDWVVMRCLEKDRERRYDTANALGDELQRYLKGEAVLAGPPSVRYRVGKFVGRNRLPVAIGAAGAVILAAGFVSLTVMYQWAQQQRDLAEREASAALLAKEEEETQREIAERTLAFLNEEVFGQLDPLSGGGANTTVKEMVDRAADQIPERFTGQPELEHDVRQMLGTTYARLGRRAEAEAQLLRAEELGVRLYGKRSLERADTLRVRALSRMWALLEPTEESLANMREAASISEEILGPADDRTLRDNGDVTWMAKDLSRRPYSELDAPTLMVASGYRGKGESAEEMRAVIERLNKRVEAYWRGGDRERAHAIIHEFCEPVRTSRFEFVRERLPLGLGAYAGGLGNAGHTDLAEALLTYSIEWGREHLEAGHPSTLLAVGNMASLTQREGRLDEAEAYGVEMLEGYRRNYGENHSSTYVGLTRLGQLMKQMERNEEAESYLANAHGVSLEIYGEDHIETALSLNELGLLASARGKMEPAERFFREAFVVGVRAHGGDDPRTLAFQCNIVSILAKMERFERAGEVLIDIEQQMGRIHADGTGSLRRSQIDRLIKLLDTLHESGAAGDFAARAGVWRERLAELVGDEAASGDGD